MLARMHTCTQAGLRSSTMPAPRVGGLAAPGTHPHAPTTAGPGSRRSSLGRAVEGGQAGASGLAGAPRGRGEGGGAGGEAAPPGPGGGPQQAEGTAGEEGEGGGEEEPLPPQPTTGHAVRHGPMTGSSPVHVKSCFSYLSSERMWHEKHTGG
jgi:hypothetical protein